MTKEKYKIISYASPNRYTEIRNLFLPMTERQRLSALKTLESSHYEIREGEYLFNGAIVTDLSVRFQIPGVQVQHETERGLVKVLNLLGLPVPK